MRIRVSQGIHKKEIVIKSGEVLSEALVREGFHVDKVCGGMGRCGKCTVQVVSGRAEVTAGDAAVFSNEELMAGMRLSCCLYPSEDLEVNVPQENPASVDILTTYETQEYPVQKLREREYHTDSKEVETISDSACKIAIDLGTTTIVMELLEGNGRRTGITTALINSQGVFGADVISRIQAAASGKGRELQACVRRDIGKGIEALLQKAGVSYEQVVHIVISGNTTMLHLLMGYNCEGLGVHPFTPVNIDWIEGTDEEILRRGTGRVKVTLLAGISTFVGGDIVSGLYACGFGEREEIDLLVDLGTNGELALGNKEKLLVASTAAGPAFEGGNISCGMASVAGAICAVAVEDKSVHLQTIKDAPPIGICGTGVVEAVAELLKEGLMDETGALAEEYFEKGFPLSECSGRGFPERSGRTIVFTQKDIREVQLAKAAILAGIETLLLRYGISKEEVARVYIAGGFGYKLNLQKAMAIGMLPKEFAGRVEAVGNSSLAGAVKYLTERGGECEINKLINISEEIRLAGDEAFQDYYINAMFFHDYSRESTKKDGKKVRNRLQ